MKPLTTAQMHEERKAAAARREKRLAEAWARYEARGAAEPRKWWTDRRRKA